MLAQLVIAGKAQVRSKSTVTVCQHSNRTETEAAK